MDAAELAAYPPHTTFAVTVGPLGWLTYVLTCPVCGATESMNLRVQNPHWTVGEIAWVVCPNEHQFNHPLVYPQMVHAFLAAPSADAAIIAQSLEAIGWQPHRRSWPRGDDPDVELMSDETALVEHEPWNLALDRSYWQAEWPELVAVADGYYVRQAA